MVAGAPEGTDSVSVLVPLPGAAMVAGAKLEVVPLGTPLTDKAIAELKPFVPVVVMGIGAEPPGTMLNAVALRARLKLGGRIVRLIV